jgi:phosphocarrier protein
LSPRRRPPGGATPRTESRITVTIRNQRGLHARAAAKFVKLACTFDADIQVSRGGQTVSGRSIMGLMMLAAGPGNKITLEAKGADADAALAALKKLIGDHFDEN